MAISLAAIYSQDKLGNKFLSNTLMTIFGYKEVLLAILSFLFLCHWRLNRNTHLTNWLIVGMLPQLLCNFSHLHDYFTHLSKYGSTWEFRGPWFTNLNFVVTSDPLNVHHILIKNCGNYSKGPHLKEILEGFGDGIFSSDAKEWKQNRAILQSLFKWRSFETLLERTIQQKIQSSLLPLLDHIQEQGMEVNLQSVLRRFAFDTICSIVVGFDPESLATHFPKCTSQKAYDQIHYTMFLRHFVPRSFWKLQKWLQIGQEKKMTEARKVVDSFLHECVTSSRKRFCKSVNAKEMEGADLLRVLIMEEERKGHVVDDKFLMDTASSLLVAGRDTITSGLTWFFWLVATHPLVEAKILEELKEKFAKKDKSQMILGVEDVKQLVYLHGAICEALRLFPPIPLDQKHAKESDTLPSGHHINPDTMIVYSSYAMGRSEQVWGADCLEFKPERWISKSQGIIHVPSYKFLAFNAGPRTCLGKDMSFIELKMVASAILWNYRIQLVKGHIVSPNNSIALLVRRGLKVNITKRDT